MLLEMFGGSKQKREYTESLCGFVAKKLMPRLADKLIINIEFKRNLLKGESIYGDCIWEDDDVRPRYFTIRVDAGMPLRETLTTIAHEMVHVKQFAQGKLKYLTTANKHKFDGKYFSDSLDYWDRPWEIEAHGREIGLFIQWCHQEKLGKYKWTQDPYFS